ncbi:MAG: hypothetical protein WDM70_00285 [Nitrosomonadales bacterium]
MDEAMQSLGNKLDKENAETAHTAWRAMFKSWSESLKTDQGRNYKPDTALAMRCNATPQSV